MNLIKITKNILFKKRRKKILGLQNNGSSEQPREKIGLVTCRKVETVTRWRLWRSFNCAAVEPMVRLSAQA